MNLLIGTAFQTILDNTKDMIFIKDANLVYVAASKPFVEMVGKNSEEEIVGRTDLDVFEDESLAKRYIADDHKLLKKRKNLINYIEPITDDDGQARYGTTSKYILSDDDGNIIGILGVTKDITREYIARQHYQQELKYLFKLPEGTYAVSYIDVDDWRIISQRRQDIEGATMQECHTMDTLIKAAQESIIDKESEAFQFYCDFTSEVLQKIYASGRTNVYFNYRRRLTDGTIRWVYNDIRFLIDVDSGHLCAMLSAKDIDAKKQQEQKLMEEAQLDKMTMLFNRETTMEKIRHILQTDIEEQHALFIIDVDNFKSLNDTLGHQAGDDFLIALAEILKDGFRESDIVGRIGGDEFFAFMKNVSDFKATTHKAQEMLDEIARLCTNYPINQLSGSIGIGMYPENGKTLEELYANADSALYQAKRAGKNQYVFATM